MEIESTRVCGNNYVINLCQDAEQKDQTREQHPTAWFHVVPLSWPDKWPHELLGSQFRIKLTCKVLNASNVRARLSIDTVLTKYYVLAAGLASHGS